MIKKDAAHAFFSPVFIQFHTNVVVSNDGSFSVRSLKGSYVRASESFASMQEKGASGHLKKKEKKFWNT